MAKHEQTEKITSVHFRNMPILMITGKMEVISVAGFFCVIVLSAG